MYAKSTSATTAKLYTACSNAGMQVIDITLNTNSVTVNNRVEQLYDSDRASPATVQSTDTNFDYIFTHSAWPTDDGQYIFTTDELAAERDYPNLYSPNDINLYASNGVLKSPRRIGAFLRTWKTSLLGTSSSLKGGYYVPELSTTGMTNLSQIDTNWIPNTIHQMFVRGKYLYVSHYTQGFRVMNIANPESMIEDGYYDDVTQTLSIDPANSMFFRKTVYSWPNWALGIYGVFPDADRPGIVYAGGTDGFYTFGFLPQLAENNQTIGSSATAKEGQRKIVQDASGNYHVVFYSYGEIFYRKYVSGTWQSPVKISYDNDNNNYPSIAIGSANQIMITWQRINGTNYDVYFSMSTDGGTSWNNKYILGPSVSSVHPVPVIIYNPSSLRKTICYVTNSGLYSKHTTTSAPTSAANWTTTQVTTISDESPTIASSGNSGYNMFSYRSGTSIYYRYQNNDGTWTSSPSNLSNMVPGASVNYSPTISGVPADGGVHLAWIRYDNGSGTPINPRTFYTKNTSANGGWPYQYWQVTSGDQYSPTITALATNKIDLFYTDSNYQLMYTRNNGTTWSSPVSKGTGGFCYYPSVSTGSTTANYIWTSGIASPFTVNVGSTALSKGSEFNPEVYSRSIAIMNNPEEYLEVVLNKIYFKMKDGSTQRVDFTPADLEELKTKEKFDLTPNNAWNLMKGIKDLTIPVGADELVFDYTVRGENIDKVIEGNPNKIDLSFGLNLLTKAEKAERENSITVENGKITETKFEGTIPLNSVNAERGFDKVEIGLKIKGLNPKSTVFASLGHIFDYTNVQTPNESAASKINNNETIGNEVLTSENYPNPFNPTTLIRFTIKYSGKVTLKVYDVLGREVAELFNGFHEPGSYEVPFNGSNLPSGVYFYNLTSKGNSITKKMLLLK